MALNAHGRWGQSQSELSHLQLPVGSSPVSTAQMCLPSPQWYQKVPLHLTHMALVLYTDVSQRQYEDSLSGEGCLLGAESPTGGLETSFTASSAFLVCGPCFMQQGFLYNNVSAFTCTQAFPLLLGITGPSCTWRISSKGNSFDSHACHWCP